MELNVAEGIIKNTTTNMEYSTDGNRFTSARNGNTPVAFVNGMEISIREKVEVMKLTSGNYKQ